MLLVMVFIGVVATVSCVPLEDLLKKEWLAYKLSYLKEYLDEIEDQNRLRIYTANKRLINEHNKRYESGNVTYKMALNIFADYLDDEYETHDSNASEWQPLFRDNSAPEIFVKPSNISIPSSIDWRKKGAVTGVKNQKQCGSCWAFAATGALEAQYFRKTGTLVSLSEQNLVDCTSSYGNDGCNGGYPNNAFKYIKDHGIDSEKSYPYQNRQNSCKFNPKKSAASSYGYGIIPKGNEQKMIEALATVGPLSIAIDNSHHSFKFYSSGIYNEPHCNPNKLEHAVLAVGYDKDYYIIKNSWGTRWGENGYIRIARNRNNLCGVASLASYPKV